MNSKKIKKIAIGGLLLAIGIVLPLILHVTGIQQIGQIILPMHIPVLLAGIILGPWYGCVIGILCPAIGTLISGMPTIERMPFMIIELFIYGLVSGLMVRLFLKVNNKELKDIKLYEVLISLVVAMVAGRCAYLLSLLAATYIFGFSVGGPIVAWTATVIGVPGIIIQLLLIPSIVMALKKAKLLTY